MSHGRDKSEWMPRVKSPWVPVMPTGNKEPEPAEAYWVQLDTGSIHISLLCSMPWLLGGAILFHNQYGDGIQTKKGVVSRELSPTPRYLYPNLTSHEYNLHLHYSGYPNRIICLAFSQVQAVHTPQNSFRNYFRH